MGRRRPAGGRARGTPAPYGPPRRQPASSSAKRTHEPTYVKRAVHATYRMSSVTHTRVAPPCLLRVPDACPVR
eukprot:5292026-Prymnesium_polylepis.1